jgi:vancomycin resistance protein YoaR
VPASIKAINEKLVAGQHTIALEFIVTPPAVGDDATADKLQIKELIQKQTSYFRGSSADRVHNIQVAASRFHGVLVPPGSTFSMSDTMGDVSLDNGYAEALIIQDGRTIQGVGGGVCQVSTTLFRTVFFAGFPVVERYAHAYRVHYYEQTATGSDSKLAGLDATVYVPLVDFQFSNNTPYWLLMEVYVNPGNSSITWKFYSTSDGRKVDWNTTGPQNIVKPPEPLLKQNNSLAANEVNQIDWAAEGSDITVNRTVTRNDGSVLFQDTITTHYQPWRAIYEYGPETSPQVLDELKRR